MEYRIARGWRIFAIVFGAAFFILGIVILIKTFTSTVFPVPLGLFLALPLSTLGVLAYLDTTRTLVVVDDHTLSVTRLAKTRSALLSEIDGYRRGDKDAFAIVLKNGDKPLNLPQNLERRKELIEWFERKYEDVDARARAAETEVLLDNDQYGLTRDERISRLAAAGKIDNLSTVAGTVLMFWALFYPHPFAVVMLLLLAAPLISIYATWYYKGLMKLYKRKTSPYPSMVPLIFMATAAAFYVAEKTYHLNKLDQHAWSLLAGTTIVAAVICMAACRRAIASSTAKVLTYVMIVVTSWAYSSALLIFTNCYFDRSVAHVYHVEVESKRVNKSSRSTTYHLSLSSWEGGYKDGEEFWVPKSFYYEVSTHDSIRVFQKKGKWDAPWYFLVR